MEKKNKKKYNEQVLQEEHCSFTLLVFTSDRGMSNETKRFCMRLSELTREKNVTHYSETSASIKRKTCCSLLRSAVICICGWRSRKHQMPTDSIVDAEVVNNVTENY